MILDTSLTPLPLHYTSHRLVLAGANGNLERATRVHLVERLLVVLELEHVGTARLSLVRPQVLDLHHAGCADLAAVEQLNGTREAVDLRERADDPVVDQPRSSQL